MELYSQFLRILNLEKYVKTGGKRAAIVVKKRPKLRVSQIVSHVSRIKMVG